MKSSTKIAKEATISFVGSGIGDSIRYIYIALLARFVGVEYLGIYSLATAVTRIAEVFGKAGLDGGVLRYVSMRQGLGEEHIIQQNIRSTLKMGLVFSLLVMLVQILLSGLLVYSVFTETSFLHTVIIVYSITLPFSILTLIAANATQGFMLLKYKVFVINILAPVVLAITMILTYFLVSSEMAIILPVVVSSFVSFFVILGFLKRITGIQFSQIFPEKFDRGILQYSYPLMLVAIIDTFMYWMDVMLLGYFTDTETVGLYHPAARTAGLIRVILVALMSIASPMLALLLSQKKRIEVYELYRLVVRWITSLTLPFVILFMIFPQKIMLLFGGQFLQAASVLYILAIAALIHSFTSIGSATLNLSGHPKVNLANSIVAVTVNFILNILWIPKYGITGAAWATFVALTFLGFLRSVEVWYLIKLHPFYLKLLKPIIAGVVTYFILFMVKPYLMPYHTIITLALAIAFILLSFGGILWLLGFDADDKEFSKALLILRKSSRKIIHSNGLIKNDQK